jgi:hypothetical protein
MIFKRLRKKWLESQDRASTPLVRLAHQNHIQTAYVSDYKVIKIPDQTLIKVLWALGVNPETGEAVPDTDTSPDFKDGAVSEVKLGPRTKPDSVSSPKFQTNYSALTDSISDAEQRVSVAEQRVFVAEHRVSVAEHRVSDVAAHSLTKGNR